MKDTFKCKEKRWRLFKETRRTSNCLYFWKKKVWKKLERNGSWKLTGFKKNKRKRIKSMKTSEVTFKTKGNKKKSLKIMNKKKRKNKRTDKSEE